MSTQRKKLIQTILLYAATLAAMVVLLQWLQWRFVLLHSSFDIYIGLIALVFTGLGIWLATRLVQPKKEIIVVEKEIYLQQNKETATRLNDAEREKLGLTHREMEVLQLMAAGLSNQEIAGKLFLSLNTIKTHGSRLFEKMEVKRRTQAIEKAKRLQLIH